MNPGDRRRLRLAYIGDNCHAFCLGIAAMLGGTAAILHPVSHRSTALGQVLGSAAPLWNVLYVAGGMAVVFGLARPSLRTELAGLALLGAALVDNAVSLIVVHGWVGFTSATIYVAWAAASFRRARVVWQWAWRAAGDAP